MVHDRHPLDLGAWHFTSKKISTLHIPWNAAATVILKPRLALRSYSPLSLCSSVLCVQYIFVDRCVRRNEYLDR